MLLSTAVELASFVAELKRETDRGLPLVAAALIDDRLAETLRAYLRACPSASRLLEGANAPLGTLSSRNDTCHALGLIDDYEHGEIGLIRKIRNEFAHAKHGLSFDTNKVVGLCASLTSELPRDEAYFVDNARSRFVNATVCVVLRLYRRPDWVVLERRRIRTWPQISEVESRHVNMDAPPDGDGRGPHDHVASPGD